MPDTVYIDYGYQLITKFPQSRTIRGEYDGQVIWIKQSVPPKARIWHKLQKYVALMLPMQILRVTVSAGGGKTLRLEGGRLREFADNGLHVPQVLGVNDDMLILTDLGPQLRAYLDNETDAAKRLDVLKKTMQGMAGLHAKGMVHGRPYLRDMTWDGDKIGFLDLEENPLAVMDLKVAKARDIWIFLGAAARFARAGRGKGPMSSYDPAIMHAIFGEYGAQLDEQTEKELKKFIRLIRPLRWAVEHFLWNHVGNDVRQSVIATICIEKHLNM